MKALKKYFKKFIREDEGAELIEYVVLMAGILVLAVVVFAIIDKFVDKGEDQIEIIDNMGRDPGVGGGGLTPPTI